jgi:hypothetical protein
MERTTPSIEVTFKDHFPLHLVTTLQEGFLGLCAATSAGASPHILVLHPTPHEYHVLTLQLRELESEGALTFVNVPRHAP